MCSSGHGQRIRHTSHTRLRKAAVDELVKEGYSAESIRIDAPIDNKKVVDVMADTRDGAVTLVECKSFKHTNDYASHFMKGERVTRRVLCQPFFDVDEMWLVYRSPTNKYVILKILRPDIE